LNHGVESLTAVATPQGAKAASGSAGEQKFHRKAATIWVPKMMTDAGYLTVRRGKHHHFKNGKR